MIWQLTKYVFGRTGQAMNMYYTAKGVYDVAKTVLNDVDNRLPASSEIEEVRRRTRKAEALLVVHPFRTFNESPYSAADSYALMTGDKQQLFDALKKAYGDDKNEWRKWGDVTRKTALEQLVKGNSKIGTRLWQAAGTLRSSGQFSEEKQRLETLLTRLQNRDQEIMQDLQNPLFVAAYLNAPKAFARLWQEHLQAKGNIEIEDIHGATLAHIAASHESAEITKLMLAPLSSATAAGLLKVRNKEGLRPLFVAFTLENYDNVPELLAKGADPFDTVITKVTDENDQEQSLQSGFWQFISNNAEPRVSPQQLGAMLAALSPADRQKLLTDKDRVAGKQPLLIINECDRTDKLELISVMVTAGADKTALPKTTLDQMVTGAGAAVETIKGVGGWILGHGGKGAAEIFGAIRDGVADARGGKQGQGRPARPKQGGRTKNDKDTGPDGAK